MRDELPEELTRGVNGFVVFVSKAKYDRLAAALESISNGEGAGGLAETERLQEIARAALAGTAEPREDLTDGFQLLKARRPVDVKTAAHCVWTYTDSEYSVWETEYGRESCMIDGTPKDNDYAHCPGCGKPLVERTADQPTVAPQEAK